MLPTSLWHTTPLRASLPQNEEEWQALYRWAIEQTVVGLLYQGLERLPQESLPSPSLMIQWVAALDGIERRNGRMNRAIGEVERLMNGCSAQAVLFKGQALAANYDTPQWRECGDIDIYLLPPTDGKVVERWLETNGIEVAHHADGAISYTIDGIEVEHHTRLIDLHRPALQGYLLELEEQEGFIPLVIDGVTTGVLTPSPLLHLLIQNAHILKHAMGNGVGMRQLCDMARSYHHWHNDIDGDRLREVYRRCGLLRWSRLLHTFLVRELGMPIADLPYAEELLPSADALKSIISEGGNFGQHTTQWQHTSSSPLRRKWHTFTSFLRHASFSLRYAPSETFWTLLTLAKGQIKGEGVAFGRVNGER